MSDADEIKSLPCGIVVMRHGHREDSDNPLWQIKARFPFDTPLAINENEICAAAQQLKAAGRTFHVVYTSPFLRCLETTQRLLRALGCERVPVFIHGGLAEVHNPKLLFKTSNPSFSHLARYWLWRATYKRHSRPIRQRFAIKARILDSSWPQVPESEYNSTIRFRQTIMELAAGHPGQQVLIVSHGKSVQVAQEALGCPERIYQVGFGGFVSCRPKSENREAKQQGDKDAHRSTSAMRWTDFEIDTNVPYFNVEFYTEG
ncbi:hypothetical protein VaNZ11_007206 [Volvox africanus]|uniref:Uncharacterized protein n=1 Tax=Volvox africanus TaxID=51714 RepID=A0ABQ5S2E9_9CHLO|nr:hypothetical protein VaNZ11_007206 [Volvox africanus]